MIIFDSNARCQKLRKDRKDKHFLSKPVFPGGSKALKKVVQENLRYPAEALEKKIEGTVSLKYTIDHKGHVVEGQIISGLGHGCDEEAIRIVKLFRFEVGRNRGIRTTFHKNIHIHFKLPKQKPQVKGIQYQFQKTKKEVSRQKPPKASSSYHYTINIGSISNED